MYRNYSTSSSSSIDSNSVLDPWFISGYADAESSFMIIVNKNSQSKLGFLLHARFAINIHKKDHNLLKKIASFFGVGKIAKESKDSIMYRVTSIKEINPVILPHFDKYPLLSKKRADFELFQQAVELMNNKVHLTIEGLEKIISIKSSLNLGIPDDLKKAFLNVTSVPRPEVELPNSINPNWIRGFTSGEGSFGITIRNSPSHKVGQKVSLLFRITQHSRDTDQMKNLKIYFNCGNYYEDKSRNKGNYVVQKFTDIYDQIIPFFEKYPVEGEKSKDFKDFCIAARLVDRKAHLTIEGLEEIKKIKGEMNRSRDNKT